MISRSLPFQHAVELVVEDVFTDQPASVVSKARQVLELPGEQFVVIDVVAVLGFPQFILKSGGIVLTQFPGNPVEQLPTISASLG